MKGLYRRYDGEYVYVHSKVLMVKNFKSVYGVEYEYIDEWSEGQRFCVSEEEFFSRTYESVTVEKGEKKSVKIPIIDHPSNRTGQREMFMRVRNIDRPVHDIKTEDLVEELKARKYSLLSEMDIEGFNESTVCREYVVGVPSEAFEINGREVGANVDVDYVTEDLEEAKKKLYEYAVLGKNRFKLFKRITVEEKV